MPPIMIRIDRLTESDVGRGVVYHREFCERQVGKLSSWNDRFVFVRFKGPTGESCEPEDVSFEFPLSRDAKESGNDPN